MLEDDLIADLDLPLNLMGNRHNRFHATMTRTRQEAKVRARELPILPNPGRRK
ncbi:hypothetical protein GTV32_16370 [Gordonia sp. SID5947]|uniref:hypothetical protein n=1 Tax=Gordonia sp. SID5947 TaxID=2690315 RepID=UPI00136F5736|nr:hypothetical protein [Gordonia sp. SID5947]MYR07778.1 hypothetical protein [Gordonia sp. SID5947]